MAPRFPRSIHAKIHPRLTVGAVNVKSGELRYFDSRDGALGLDEVMASGALPPGFPAIRVDGEAYWDGGLYSNTPLEAVLDDNPRRDSVIFSVNVWQPVGHEPESLWQVMAREKDIRYATRDDSHIARQKQIHRLRHVIRELARNLPSEKRNQPECRELAAGGCGTTMHGVRLLAPALDGEGYMKDLDFSAAGIRFRCEAGLADARRMIARAVGCARRSHGRRDRARAVRPHGRLINLLANAYARGRFLRVGLIARAASIRRHAMSIDVRTGPASPTYPVSASSARLRTPVESMRRCRARIWMSSRS